MRESVPGNMPTGDGCGDALILCTLEFAGFMEQCCVFRGTEGKKLYLAAADGVQLEFVWQAQSCMHLRRPWSK